MINNFVFEGSLLGRLIGAIGIFFLSHGMSDLAVSSPQDATNAQKQFAQVTSPDKKSEATFLKVDQLLIHRKYQSDPFLLREKAFGKRVETLTYHERFVDEGSHARFIDAFSGFFCLMKGSEYKNANKIGFKVVQGTLAEHGGRVGLNDCKFLRYEPNGNWEASDGLDKLLAD